MLKRILLFLIVYSSFVNAQSFDITIGKEFNSPEKKLVSNYIGSNENSFFVLSSKPGEEELALLSSFNRKTSAQDYEKKLEFKKAEVLLQTFHKNGKVLLFSKLEEKKEFKKFYLLRVFDAKTGNAIGNIQVVEEIDTKVYTVNSNLTVVFSPDDKKMLIVLEKEPASGGRLVTTKIYESESLKKIWEKQPLENIDKSTVYASGFTVDNESRLIYLAAYLKPGSQEDVKYAICIHSSNNTSKSIIKIPSENKTLILPTLEYVEASLVCTGSFYEGINTSAYKAKKSGLFLLTIDLKKDQIQNESFEYLRSELQDKFSSYVQSTPSFSHQGCYMIENELFVVKCYAYVLATYQGQTLLNRQEFIREILVLKYNSDKSLQWMRIIPHCTAVSANAIQVICNKNLNILYYDSNKNIKKFPDVNVFEPAKYKVSGGIGASVLTICATVNKEGVLTRTVIERPDTLLRLWETGDRFKQGENIPLLPLFDKKNGTRRIDLISLRE